MVFLYILFSIIILFPLVSGILALSTSKYYDQIEGRFKYIRWISLKAKEGDIIDHTKYRKFVGISSLILFLFLTIWVLFFLCYFNEICFVELTIQHKYFVNAITNFFLGTFLSVLYFLSNSSLKEKYIDRIESEKPNTILVYVIIPPFLLIFGFIGFSYLYM